MNTRGWNVVGWRPVGVVLAVTLVLGVGVAGGVRALQEDRFPHERHQGLFPLCTGCHQGIPASDEADYYPSPEACARCHDGDQEERVEWSPPVAVADNVTFSHAEHARSLEREGDPAQVCEGCHSEPGRGRMSVSEGIQLGQCWSCHEHRSTDHQVDADCTTCHVPLAESRFTRLQIEDIPVPADHEIPGFLSEEHGRRASTEGARCATCHTQDRCAACHVDADRGEIQAIPAAPAQMELPPAVAHYNEPSSHEDAAWLENHRSAAGTAAAECVTCHTSDDCRACHVAPVPGAVAGLPSRSQVVAPGVGVTAHAPDTHESLFFMGIHGSVSAASGASCATCHEQTFCVACHDGPANGGYHPPSFVSRHSAAAFGRTSECSTCHSTEVFCRACHQESGLTGFGRLGPGYHDAEPLWLLRHGQGARQNLESCVSCHQQNDCTQCHGVLGAFKINPHGPDFDAQRAWERSPRACFACHARAPINGSSP
ncbi:MAG: cytochrome c3 family protein [Gemmatimonadota bacterium]|nr:cytochrome c3 family protein [Gemmatimonadota bacterium]MDH5760075.1 cytochrome c3 family protein [Gemmatimonadota bacterium]